MGDRQSWRGAAACSDLGYEEADRLFFIGQGQTGKAGRLFCREHCNVRLRCLEFALIYEEQGIWGGTTDAERKDYPDYLVEQLREREKLTVGLESRNPNDFIDRQYLLSQAVPPSLTQQVYEFDLVSSFDFPEQEAEPLEVQLAVLAHLLTSTNDLLAS